MRIALLAPFGVRPKGTVQARVLPLAHALAENGHLVRVVIPPWDDPDARRGRQRLEAIEGGVHIVTLGLPRVAPNSAALTWGLVKEALWPKGSDRWSSKEERALTEFGAEIVHVFKPVGYSGLAGFALSGLGVPWVLDVDDWEGRGGWADVNHYSVAQKVSILTMESLLPRLTRGVTAASKTLEARAWNMGIGRERVTYLPNGVGRDKYAKWLGVGKAHELRANLGLDGEPVVLLYTRFDVFPVEWVAEVMKRVLVDHPQAKLVVVGQGFDGEEVELLGMFNEMGMGGHIMLAGFVEGETLGQYLAMADVCIYPMEDTLLNRSKSPVKVLEPMVVGLPIVAHRVGQAAEFIGDAGVLVAPGDVEGMGREVAALLGGVGRREQLGELARKRVWGEFGWDKLGALAEGAYGAALEG